MNLIDYLNIKIVEVTAEKVLLSLEIAEIHHQPFGIVHGGLNAVLVETACSLGANAYLQSADEVAVGLDVQANHLRSVSSGTLTVIATPNHLGRKTQVWEATIYDDKNHTTSVGRCSLFTKKKN